MNFTLRAVQDDDLQQLLTLYPDAFPDEDLTGLVSGLHMNAEVIGLVALAGDEVIGHVALANCTVQSATRAIYLLGPLAVSPTCQRQGVGTALIQASREAAMAANASHICLLGNPRYYIRHGFEQETSITTPYDLPKDWAPAWQSLRVSGHDEVRGVLNVPEVWQNPAYWS